MSFYYTPYFIFNTILALIYPILKTIGLQTVNLQVKDTWGFQREYTILSGILTITILRFLRYFTNMKKFVNDAIFYAKFCNFILFYFFDLRLACWYLCACVIVWILFKIPFYNGASKVFYFSSDEMFKERVFKKTKGVKGDNYWIVIFFSNYSDTCIFV